MRWGKPHPCNRGSQVVASVAVRQHGIVKVITDSVRVLIVDDQESFRSAASLVVQLTDGFEVAGEAATGEEGVALADEIQPDLILMDMNLPGIDGTEATRQILATHPSVKIVGLSTYEEYEPRALDAGASAFISKSDFDPERLIQVWSLTA